jgi:DNA-binding transcriptional LysR family regulator
VERDIQGTTRVFAIDVKGPMIVNGPATSLAAAVSGVGLAYNISTNVQPLIDQGLLEPCLETFMPESPGFFAYFPHRNQVLPKLRAFLDFWREKNRLDALAED